MIGWSTLLVNNFCKNLQRLERTESAFNKRFIRLLLLPSAYLLFVTCDEILDIAQPEVEILSPIQGEVDTGYVHIKIEVSDNKQLDYVDLYFDGKKINTFKIEMQSHASLQDIVDLADYQQDKDYTIEAKAYDTQGNWETDEVTCFGYGKSPDAPTLSSPANGVLFTNTAMPTFSWNSSTDAVNYQILVDNNQDFASPEIDEIVSGTEYTSTVTLDAVANHWRVRARNNIGLWGPWSGVRSFMISGPVAPTLVSPANGAVFTNTNMPSFNWNASADAVDYEIVVDNDQGFGSPEIDEVVTSTEYASTVALNAGVNYWKIRARNNVGLWGKWSEVRSFTISGPPAPTLVIPSNGVSLMPQPSSHFRWDATTGAVDYEILVDNDQDFESPEIDEIVTGTEYTSAASLNEDVYYWKVRARNNIGLWGEWSLMWSFTIELIELTEVGSYDTPEYAVGVAMNGNYAYVATCVSGLRVINVSNPSNPVETGFSDTLYCAEDVVVSGNYAYVATYGSGLRVVDISNPASPFEVGSFEISGHHANDITLSGNYVYVVFGSYTWPSGLRVVNITNPSNPVLEGSYDTPGDAYGIEVSGGYYAYVADGWWDGLRVIAVSTATSPVEVGSYETSGHAEAVAVSGNYTYLVILESGLHVINVSNPANPARVGYCDTPGGARGVALSGNYAYVASGSAGGLRVIDVSNPASPLTVGYYDTPGIAFDVAVSGNYAYVADHSSGLRIIDISPFTGGD